MTGLPRQRWRSLGHVYVAAGESAAHMTHASYPTPLVLPDGSVRVFYSPRDAQGRSTIFSVDLRLREDGFSRLGPPEGPWLEAGSSGLFDDAGASVGWVGWRPDGGIECWYLGWTLGRTLPFRTAVGRAVAGPGRSVMSRLSPAPALDRHDIDPISLTYPWLLPDADGCSVYYGTHRWPPRQGSDIEHVIRVARRDGSGGGAWRRDAVPVLAPAGSDEWGLSRPSVLRDDRGLHMWYCRRLADYRLGYAFSSDGISWRRADDTLIFATPEAAWEAGGRAYPAVFDHQGRRWMLYNGTGYGRTGFGLALLDAG